MDIIDIFNSVRDLTYHCPESKRDVDQSCWGKHRILHKKLKQLGYDVRYRVCEFRWDGLRTPKEIIDKSPKEQDFHLYLEIKLDNKWVILDCSNDPDLPSYNEWDGKSNTKFSVKCIKILSPEESAKLEESYRKNYELILEKYHDLYMDLNKFLETVRKSRKH